MPETFAAMVQNDRALGLLSQSIDLRWRDIEWLKRSRFLGGLLELAEWRKLEHSINL